MNVKETIALYNSTLSLEVLRGRLFKQVEEERNPMILKTMYLFYASLKGNGDAGSKALSVKALDGVLKDTNMSYDELRHEAMMDKYGEYLS